MNWFDSIVTLENMVKSFNLSNSVENEEEKDGAQKNDEVKEVKSKMIPLCISDLLQRLLLSKVDQTVERYTTLVQESLIKDKHSKLALVSELLQPQIDETKAQIEQVEVLKEVS